MASNDIENFFAEVNGTLDAVVQTCVLLLATHPQKESLLAYLSALADKAATLPDNANEQHRSRVRGIQNVVLRLAEGVKIAEQANIIRNIDKSGKGH